MEGLLRQETRKAASIAAGVSKPDTTSSELALYSRVPGRDRWYVPAIEDNPRLAAELETVLRTEDGIESAQANPLTGRILVHYRRGWNPEALRELIGRALEFGPMSREEYAALRSQKLQTWTVKNLVAAELCCSALKFSLFGACCPLALAAAGLLILAHRRL